MDGMKVLVTGCSGRVGSTTVSHLCDRGTTVVGLDLAEPAEPRVDFRRCDLMDFDSLLPHVRGVDAVLHLAAWANPRLARSQDVFALNDAGSFNVFQACAEADVRRVVAASSINAIGFFFGTEAFDLTYLPVDEDHPCLPSDPYSFSKQVLEEIGGYFWRREGISSTHLRFGAGLRPMAEILQTHGEGYRRARTRVLELLEAGADGEAEVLRMRGAYDSARKARPFETGTGWGGMDPDDVHLMNLVHNYWSFVDLDDAARGMELALTATYEGSHPLFIVDRVNVVGVDANGLRKLFYPGVAVKDGRMDGPQSLVNWRKASEMIGFETAHSIGDQYDTLFKE